MAEPYPAANVDGLEQPTRLSRPPRRFSTAQLPLRLGTCELVRSRVSIPNMGAKKTDDGKSIVWGILLFLVFAVVAWPYFVGTWLAVQLGADNPSTARSVTGWLLEVLWLGGLVSLAGWAWLKEKQQQDEARRLELLKQQRKREFGSAGARLYEQADASVSTIAASEAARTGWLGDPTDFDFRADLEAIAANLRRAEQIRTVTADASSIRDFSQADKQMLHDAKVEIAKLENSVKQRVELIGKCAQQAADIDRALREERESGVMANRREDLRGRLGPILYGSQKMPIDGPSESADVVTARAAAFHELKALIDKHRIAASDLGEEPDAAGKVLNQRIGGTPPE